MDGAPGISLKSLSLFIEQFPTIPTISIVSRSDFELIFSCGKIGVDEILFDTELTKLKEKIFQLVNCRQVRVSVHDLGLDTTKCSERVKQALKIIESRCNKIKFGRSIAEELGITSATISRKFKQELGVGIKCILNIYKVRFAVQLLKYPKLSIKEITYLEGFSDKFHFNKCFKKITGVSPKTFRDKNIEIYFSQVFQEKSKKGNFYQKKPTLTS